LGTGSVLLDLLRGNPSSGRSATAAGGLHRLQLL
jgi:hypothetical protein